MKGHDVLEECTDMSKKKNYALPALPSQSKAWLEKAASLRMPYGDWARRALLAAAEGRLKVRFTEPQLIRGRKERDEVAENFQFKAPDEEVAAWQRSAESEGLNRSEWCRQVLDYAAKRADPSFLLG